MGNNGNLSDAPGHGTVWDPGMFVYFLVKQEAKMENVTDFEMSFR